MKKLLSASAPTDQNGQAVISIQIPGVFKGLLISDDQWSGRQAISGECWFGNGAEGDQLISVDGVDTDGILQVDGTVPPPILQMFPQYPILQSSVDLKSKGGTGSPGLNLMPGIKATLTAFGEGRKIASGLYIQVTMQAATARSDTAYLNIIWDDLT